MDFSKLLSDSAKFAWKYKILWIFGFLIQFFSGSSSSNYDSNSTTNVSGPSKYMNYSPDYLQERADYLSGGMSFILVLFLVCSVALVIYLICLYISNVAETSIIKSVLLDKEGKSEEIKFGKLWKASQKHVIWQLLIDLFLIIVVVIFCLPILVMAALPILICFYLPFFIAILIFFVVWTIFAKNEVVVKDTNVITALINSLVLIFKNLGDVLLGVLVLLLPGCIIVVCLIPIVIALAIPTAIAATFLAQPLTIFSILLAIVVFLGLKVVLAAILSPVVVYFSAYWTKLYLAISEKSQSAK